MSIAAENPTDRAEQMLAIAKRLIALVSAEVKAMKIRKLDGATADFAEKERLAHAWRLEVTAIKANPALLKGAAAATMSKLKDAAKELETVLQAHAAAIQAMKQVTEGLVKAIADEIASQRRAPPAYGRSGAIQASRTQAASGLTVNAKA